MSTLFNRIANARWTFQKDETVLDRLDDLAEDRMRPISRPIERRQ